MVKPTPALFIYMIFCGKGLSNAFIKQKLVLLNVLKIIQLIHLVIMGTKVDEFNEYRQKMNERILSSDNLVIKRIYNIDTNAYLDGALPVKTKELLGLVSSLVLRCDDCIKYHLLRCHENGVVEKELFEVLAIANLVGGTIVIPHTRRAVEFWDDLNF